MATDPSAAYPLEFTRDEIGLLIDAVAMFTRNTPEYRPLLRRLQGAYNPLGGWEDFEELR